MKNFKLNNFTRGWIVGDFENSVIRMKEAEFCVKHFKAGEKENKHYHKLTSEITVVVSGKVKMNDVEYGPDDIIVMEPGEPTDFEALTDCTTIAFRNGSFPKDKFNA
jgi:quercetin dioxygenase-like cupin family protein